MEPEARVEDRRKSLMAEELRAALRERLHAGKLREAFLIGEWLLDSGPSAETFDSLLAPLERPGGQGGLIGSSDMYDLLVSLRGAPPDLRGSPWGRLLEADLLHNLCWNAEAAQAARSFEELPPRYGWMRHNRGMLLLRQHRAYDEAEREFRAAAESAPALWKALACAAECALCRGDDASAFATMDALAARLEGVDRVSARAWRGELLLWRGDYAGAVRDLSWARERGSPLAGCWLGGALLRLGETRPALAALDEALRRCPGDPEARVWRAEALRGAGAPEKALEDLEVAARMGRGPFWALVNRALASADLGDASGMRADYERLERVVRAHFEWRLRLPEGKPPAASMRAVLEAILAAGGGVRRSDDYLLPVWLPWTRPGR